MSDIKIADMNPLAGVLPGAAMIPIVYLNENYRVFLSQITPFTVTGASGSFTTRDNKTVTVVNGLITEIADGASGDGFIELED